MGSTLTVVFTGVIAAATVVYVVLTKRLWEETKKSAEAAKVSADAAKLSAEAAKKSADIDAALHRPYLGVSVLTRHNDYNQEMWAIRCCVKNYGTIPASGVRASVTFNGRLTGSGGPLCDGSEILPQAEVERFIEIRADRKERDLLHAGEPMAAHVEVTYDAPVGTRYTHKAAFPYDKTTQNFRRDRSETTAA
jgi:hypothetical protein